MNRNSETSGPVKSPTDDQRQHLLQAKKTLQFALASLCTLLDAYAFLLRRLEPPEDDQGSRGISQGVCKPSHKLQRVGRIGGHARVHLWSR